MEQQGLTIGKPEKKIQKKTENLPKIKQKNSDTEKEFYARSDADLLTKIREDIQKEQTIPVSQSSEPSPLKRKSRAKDRSDLARQILEKNTHVATEFTEDEKIILLDRLQKALKKREQSMIGVVGNLARKGVLQAMHVTSEGKINVNLLDQSAQEKYGFLKEYQLSTRSKLRQEAVQNEVKRLVEDPKAFPDSVNQALDKLHVDYQKERETVTKDSSETANSPESILEMLSQLNEDYANEKNQQTDALPEQPIIVASDTVTHSSGKQDTDQSQKITKAKNQKSFPKTLRSYWRVAAAAIVGLFGAGIAKSGNEANAGALPTPTRPAHILSIDQTPSAKLASQLIQTTSTNAPSYVTPTVEQTLVTPSPLPSPSPEASPTPEHSVKPILDMPISQAQILPPTNEVTPPLSTPDTQVIIPTPDVPAIPEVVTPPKPSVNSITGGKVFSFNQGFGHTEYAKTGVYALGIHTGWDLGVPSGTELFAPVTGEVVQASMDYANYGGCVIIKTEDGTYYLFGHMRQVDLKVGQTITTGEHLGLSGGGLTDKGHGKSTGAHLHFETYTIDSNTGKIVYQNPENYYDRTATPISHEARDDFEHE